MHNYTVNDFLRYYGDSWMIHPKSGELFRLRGPCPKNPETHVVTTLGDSLALESIDWSHVCTPETLGYRSLLDGKALYHLSRKPGRRTRKGCTPEAIIVAIPPVIRSLAGETGYLVDIERNANLQDAMAKEIYKPTYTSLVEAIARLKSVKHTLGFALSANWAVTLGLYKQEPFLLHFKNIRVAGSQDGKTWDFYDEDSRSLFYAFKEAA